MASDRVETAGISFVLVTFLLAVIVFGMWGCPNYAVYQQGLVGEAELARAEQNRQIKVEEAAAKKDAAKDLAAAEVIRAHGVAEAQSIINETLTARYIQWLMAESMGEQECDIRYIPTESQLPILEAGRGLVPVVD